MPTIVNDPPARDSSRVSVAPSAAEANARPPRAFFIRVLRRQSPADMADRSVVGSKARFWPAIRQRSTSEDDENHGSSRPRNTAGRSQVLMSRPPPGSATTAFRTGPERCGATLQPARRGILPFFKPLTIWTFAGTTTSHGHIRSRLLASKIQA